REGSGGRAERGIEPSSRLVRIDAAVKDVRHAAAHSGTVLRLAICATHAGSGVCDRPHLRRHSRLACDTPRCQSRADGRRARAGGPRLSGAPGAWRGAILGPPVATGPGPARIATARET